MKTRHRPNIHAAKENITRVEHVICASVGCRNAIALWAHQRFCSRCQARKVRRP